MSKSLTMQKVNNKTYQSVDYETPTYIYIDDKNPLISLYLFVDYKDNRVYNNLIKKTSINPIKYTPEFRHNDNYNLSIIALFGSEECDKFLSKIDEIVYSQNKEYLNNKVSLFKDFATEIYK